MSMTLLRGLAALSLCSCLPAALLSASPALAQVVYVTPNRTAPPFDRKDLFQHWVRSTEEDLPGETVWVFRPAASREFPPSRFRMAYKFARDGSCEFYFLSPDDAHRFKACTWTVGASPKAILQIVGEGTATSFRVVELTRDVLRLMPLEPSKGLAPDPASRIQAFPPPSAVDRR